MSVWAVWAAMTGPELDRDHTPAVRPDRATCSTCDTALCARCGHHTGRSQDCSRCRTPLS